MAHNIPSAHAEKHTKSISTAKGIQVSNLQNHIQNLLSGTHHTFLQGSYKNDTSISDINDVDIVAVRKTTYSSVHSGIRTGSFIPWEAIFSEIETKLKQQNLYQWTVTRGDKCIEVRTSSFKADVVPAVQTTYEVTEDPIAIYSFKTGIEKSNSPRKHYLNGVAKHNATNQRYKPTVRMFKNWVTNHFGGNEPISSYQMESLVHNAPNDKFSNDPVLSFIIVSGHILESLHQNQPIMSVCGTEDITANWNYSDREKFRLQLAHSTLLAHTALTAGTQSDAHKHWDTAFNV